MGQTQIHSRAQALDILGLNHSADFSQIKYAYEKLSKKFDPWHSGDNDPYLISMYHRIRNAYIYLEAQQLEKNREINQHERGKHVTYDSTYSQSSRLHANTGANSHADSEKTEPQLTIHEPKGMSLLEKMTNREGHMDRAEFFQANILIVVLVFIAGFIIGGIGETINQEYNNYPPEGWIMFMVLSYGLLLFFYTYTFFVSMIKRLRDIGKSGMNAFLYFIPIFGQLYWLTLFFRKGK